MDILIEENAQGIVKAIRPSEGIGVIITAEFDEYGTFVLYESNPKVALGDTVTFDVWWRDGRGPMFRKLAQ